MSNSNDNCPTCGPSDLKTEFRNGRGYVSVPETFMADSLGTMEQQVAEGMAALDHIKRDSRPHLAQSDARLSHPSLTTRPQAPDFTEPSDFEASVHRAMLQTDPYYPGIATRNFSTAETDAAPIVPIQFQQDDDQDDDEEEVIGVPSQQPAEAEGFPANPVFRGILSNRLDAEDAAVPCRNNTIFTIIAKSKLLHHEVVKDGVVFRFTQGGLRNEPSEEDLQRMRRAQLRRMMGDLDPPDVRAADEDATQKAGQATGGGRVIPLHVYEDASRAAASIAEAVPCPPVRCPRRTIRPLGYRSRLSNEFEVTADASPHPDGGWQVTYTLVVVVYVSFEFTYLLRCDEAGD